MPLYEGDSFELLQRRDEWLNIRTPEGQNGWIPRRDAALIARPSVNS